MNAHVAKEEIALLMPSTLSNYFKDETLPASHFLPDQPSLLARVGSALRWIAALPARRAVLNELSALSDHELADIGLSRSELSLVFDPQFATARAKGRALARG